MDFSDSELRHAAQRKGMKYKYLNRKREPNIYNKYIINMISMKKVIMHKMLK